MKIRLLSRHYDNHRIILTVSKCIIIYSKENIRRKRLNICINSIYLCVFDAIIQMSFSFYLIMEWLYLMNCTAIVQDPEQGINCIKVIDWILSDTWRFIPCFQVISAHFCSERSRYSRIYCALLFLNKNFVKNKYFQWIPYDFEIEFEMRWIWFLSIIWLPTKIHIEFWFHFCLKHFD